MTDSTNADCRSRLVGREFHVGRDDALYAATPLLGALRILITDAATTTTTTATTTTDECRKEVIVNNVRTAYFYVKIERDVSVELPLEDPEFGSGKVGRLRLCLYGMRDAAKGWQETLSAQLVKIGFTRVGWAPQCVLPSGSADQNSRARG